MATLRASETSRRKTLKKKFKERYSEIMEKVVRMQSLDAFHELHRDLKTIAEIFERRGIGFDFHAQNFKETIAGNIKETGGRRRR
jgi:hypothetical protein